MCETNHCIAVLGGDQRQLYVGKELAQHGFSIHLWGTEPQLSQNVQKSLSNVTYFESWEKAIENAEAVVLPLPASIDGVRVNAPFYIGKDGLRLDTLMSSIRRSTLIGGKLNDSFLQNVRKNNLFCVDYYTCESLQLKNALLTAEAAIELAMQALPVSLYQTHMAVIGFGRIGELLSRRLVNLGAYVTVYARREESLTKAAQAGCSTQPLNPSRLKEVSPKTRIIFNTVPFLLFTEEILRTIPKECVLIELASAPGGIDFAFASKAGLHTILGSALPGKYAPESAGKVIAESILLTLRNEGIH